MVYHNLFIIATTRPQHQNPYDRRFATSALTVLALAAALNMQYEI